MSFLRRSLIPAILVALLAVVLWQLFSEQGSVFESARLRQQLQQQQSANQEAEQVNERLAEDVSDLRQGMELIEEKARSEMGMVKKDEILVQIKP